MKTILAILFAVALAATAASLTPRAYVWDPSPSPGITNYVLRWGPVSVTNAGAVFNSLSVGTNLGGSLNLDVGTWFVHAVAQADDGQVSDPSNELVETVRTKPMPPGQVRRASQVQR